MGRTAKIQEGCLGNKSLGDVVRWSEKGTDRHWGHFKTWLLLRVLVTVTLGLFHVFLTFWFHMDTRIPLTLLLLICGFQSILSHFGKGGILKLLQVTFCPGLGITFRNVRNIWLGLGACMEVGLEPSYQPEPSPFFQSWSTHLRKKLFNDLGLI